MDEAEIRRKQNEAEIRRKMDEAEIVAAEFTALCAIFEEDCKVVSTPQININLRPYLYSKDTGYKNANVSALLTVRCLLGYPYKCPELQIITEQGLSKAVVDNLLNLLHYKAKSYAKEGRVMIYDLVDAAREFLSQPQPHESAVERDNYTNNYSFRQDMLKEERESEDEAKSNDSSTHKSVGDRLRKGLLNQI